MFYAILVAFIVLTTVSSCKKDKKNTTVTPPAGVLQLRTNVHIIDSTQWILYVNSVHPANGIYMYTFTPSTPNVSLKTGDIIIGSSNGGYIRKVTAISIEGGYYQLQTAQATMADVFKSGSFNFQMPINDPGQATPGVARAYSNYRLYHNSNFSVTLQNGQFDLEPVCNFTFSFDSVAGLTNFEMSATNATATDNVTFNLKGVMPNAWISDTILGTYSTSNIQLVQAWTPTGNVSVPVVVKLDASFEAKSSGGAPHNDSINTTLNWLTNDVFTGGLQYQGGQWQPLHSWVTTNAVAFDTLTNSFNSNAKLTFLSKITSSFYTIGGPQIIAGLSGTFLQLQQGATAPFNHNTTAWSVATDAQTGSPVFGSNMGTFTQSWSSDTVLYEAPYQLTEISGDSQTGNVVSTLPVPLKVKITDSNGQPVINVAIKFTVTHGGGTLSAYNLVTDQNGFAQVNWTLGPPMGNQNVTVTAVDGFGHALNGAPYVFNAIGQ